jgi:hypothetical protein
MAMDNQLPSTALRRLTLSGRTVVMLSWPGYGNHQRQSAMFRMALLFMPSVRNVSIAASKGKKRA